LTDGQKAKKLKGRAQGMIKKSPGPRCGQESNTLEMLGAPSRCRTKGFPERLASRGKGKNGGPGTGVLTFFKVLRSEGGLI